MIGDHFLRLKSTPKNLKKKKNEEAHCHIVFLFKDKTITKFYDKVKKSLYPSSPERREYKPQLCKTTKNSFD